MAKKKLKEIIIARSGPTIDGRTIGADQLREMAATYNPALYTARVFANHVRGMSGDSAFPACGDVLSVRAADENGAVVLYGTIEANDYLQRYMANDQLVFPSVEIVADFAGTSKAYLAGLGVTDTPASLGTERLSFSVNHGDRANGSGVYTSQGDGVRLEFEGGDVFESFKRWLSDTFSSTAQAQQAQQPQQQAQQQPPQQHTQQQQVQPTPQHTQQQQVQPTPQHFDANAIAAAVSAQLLPTFGAGFQRIGDALTEQANKVNDLAARITAVEQYTSTTDGNGSQRPLGTGTGDDGLVY